MQDTYSQTLELVRLAVERVAGDPADEQRYLELSFALDRAVERNLQYRELLRVFEDGAASAPPESGWAWRLAVGLTANLMGDPPATIRWLLEARQELQQAGKETSAIGSFLHGELARACYHTGDYPGGI
ncbi:MAG TPA: hypothetical protein VFU47_11295, partial [Armatimonadota bacterium]|nr:hypothetical protein [Armatimonadota bacterium]